jgi:hypothetical protein
VLVAAFAGMAQAKVDPQPVEFSIHGDTTGIGTYRWEGCKFVFQGLSALGGVDGDLVGSFAFNERGQVNVCIQYGVNEALMSIVTDSGRALILFRGETDLVNVWGRWDLIGGTGGYANLAGNGTYFGDAGWMGFTVTFTGCLYPR